MLLALCDIESKVAAAREPLQVDLTGGLADVELDLSELAAKAREEMTAEATEEEAEDHGTIRALPSPPRGYKAAPAPAWDDLDVDPADLVVIVGGAELGPYGSSRTRFEMEVDNELSAAGVLELAWTTGLVKWEDDPTPGWYDNETGDLVDEGELVERYHDAVIERVGIREFVDDGAIDPDHAHRSGFGVPRQGLHVRGVSEAEARPFVEFDPEHTVIAPVPTAPTGRSPARRAPRSGCRARRSCRGPVGARFPPGSTRWCTASARR
jgi:3-oxoacyl-[acyl-carrier protein] reductase